MHAAAAIVVAQHLEDLRREAEAQRRARLVDGVRPSGIRVLARRLIAALPARGSGTGHGVSTGTSAGTSAAQA